MRGTSPTPPRRSVRRPLQLTENTDSRAQETECYERTQQCIAGNQAENITDQSGGGTRSSENRSHTSYSFLQSTHLS